MGKFLINNKIVIPGKIWIKRQILGRTNPPRCCHQF